MGRSLSRIVSWALGKDLKYAVRTLLGSPGFSLTVIFTFGLGIGLNTAVFSLIHSIVLEPLPFPGGERMVQLWRYEETQGRGAAIMPPARAMVAAWQSEDRVLDAVAGYAEEEFHLSVGDDVFSVMGARVSPEILSLISARPLLGRLFGSADGIAGHANIVLLTEQIWTDRFGSDPDVIGRTLMVDGNRREIVGIVPRSVRSVLETGFFGALAKEILVPLDVHAAGGWSGHPNVVARLAPGVSVEAAQDRLDAIEPGIDSLIEGHSQWLPLVHSAREALSPGFRRGLWVIFGAVLVVLLIACANVATLLLVRNVTRDRELKVRAALGATRARLAMQLVSESLLLGIAGILLAVLVARWALDAAVWVAGSVISEIRAARLDPEALAFALAAGLITVLAFSLIPILELRRMTPRALTRERARETKRSVGWTAHKSLVVSQVALAMLLVLSAGLLTNSLGRLLSVDPGFETRGLAAVELDLPRERYDVGSERIAFFDEVVRGLREAPDVQAVGWAKYVPPRIAGAAGRINVERRPPAEEEHPEIHAGNWVSPTYFEAVGAPFLEGRPFTSAEISGRAQVVILNRSAAERLWPDGSGVGARIQLDSDYGPSPWMTVVGIVPDVKAWWLGDAPDRIQVYLPASDVPPRSGVILVRGTGDLGALASRVQLQVRRLDPTLPIGETFWVGNAFRESVGRQRFQTFLLSCFGIIGLLLAVLGVYGILSLSVTRRTREIGVRLALGATRLDINRRVLGQGLRAIGLGAGIGLALSLFTAGFLSDLLWGIEATDPVTYLVCTGCLVLVGLAATWISTRRAMGIDPVEALRRE